MSFLLLSEGTKGIEVLVFRIQAESICIPKGWVGAVRLEHLLPDTELQHPSLTDRETEARAKEGTPH